MELNELTIAEAQRGLREKKFSAVQLAQSCLDCVAEKNDELNILLTVTAPEALKQAEKVDASIAVGEQIAPLAGIPMTIKDNIATRGVLSTAASKILENYIPPYNATVYQKLLEDGAVMIGKANLDEFGHGASTEHSSFGVTRNPWAPDRVPGGSSGGSAAAVAAGMCLFSIGTDTGGSIRYPAGFCSVVGLKPSYGRSSRYGVMSMTSSTDVPGPLAKTVEGAALVLSRMAGVDQRDATTVPREVDDYPELIKEEIKNIKVGIPEEFFKKGISKEVKETIEAAIKKLEELGAEIVPITLPTALYGMAVYYVVTPSEISSNLGRYDGIRMGVPQYDKAENLIDGYMQTRGQGFGPEVKRRIMLGTYALSAGYYDAYYRKAQKVRTKIIQEFKDAFTKVDVIVGPTAPDVPFKIGQKGDDPVAMYLEDIYMAPASLAGLPAVSVPAGFAFNDQTKLPIGMQIIGPQFEEGRVLQVAHQFQIINNL